MPAPVTQDIFLAAQWLSEGKLVAFPTETVYGLGADALNVDAVARVFAAKGRPHFDPLIVHFHEMSQLRRAVRQFPSEMERLAEKFWPGPLTLVLPKNDWIPDLVTSGLETVAVRIPGNETARLLIERAGVPIAAPSANRFGCVSPTQVEHVVDQLGNEIDLVLDGGPCRVGVESTVLQWTSSGLLLLRHGGVTLEDLQAVVGPIAIQTDFTKSTSQSAPAGPGMLSRHYAPNTTLVIVDDISGIPDQLPNASGLLIGKRIPDLDIQRFRHVEILSEVGDLTEATARFYAALRRLDARQLEVIYALRLPNAGLGRALNDRLQRASVRE